jgi:hypothetical protein
MGSSGGGGGTQTSTTGLPTWEQPFANQYLASMLNYVFAPNAPPNQMNAPGSFPSPSQVATSPTGQSAAGKMMQQIDPTGTAYSLLAPAISGSPFLQQMAANNPGAIVGAGSPMAASQLSNPNLYGGSNPYLSWIPGMSMGVGAGGAQQRG